MSDFSEFLSEGQELIETFSRLLFEIEDQHRDGKEIDPDQINDSFRSIHTLKGLAGLAGSDDLKEFTHEIESALDALRLGKVHLDAELLNMLFEATTGFEKLLRGDAFDTEGLLGKIKRKLGGEDDDSNEFDMDWLDASIRGVLTEFEEHRLKENIRLKRRLYFVKVEFDLMEFGDGIDTVKSKLKQHGEVISFLPSADSSDPERMGFSILVGSSASAAELAEAVAEEQGVIEALGNDPAPAPAPAPVAAPKPASKPAPAPSAPSGASASAEDKVEDHKPALEEESSTSSVVSQTVRVDLRRLDSLMNLVGELSLVYTNLRSYAKRMREDDGAAQFREYQAQLLTMSRRLGQLQQGILDVRMVPIRQTFEQVKRLVHRTSRQLGKEIRLVISGADTELDKQIGERLSKPLIHIVNNAISHGIELPAEREAIGKRRAGRLELRAYQKGNRVVIELTDDGKGIDWRVIRDKALAKGFITREEADALDPAHAINLIFMPGFSSRDTADETAGRGVGMDVVKNEISSLSGLIDVATEPGKGSRFRITLPSTLAIIQALVIQSANQTYCIQLNSVLESLMVQAHEIQTIEGHEVISVRGRTLPLVHLSRVFGLEAPERVKRKTRRSERLYVVVIGLAEHRVGLIVDELLGQQDVVIKPIGRALSQVPGIAGATELGDNRTVLLLDVATLVSEAVGGVEAVLSGAGASGQQGIRVSTNLRI